MTWNLRRVCRRDTVLLAFLILFTAANTYSFAGIVTSNAVTVLGVPPAPGVHSGDQITTPNPIIFPEVIGGTIPAGGVPVDHDGNDVFAVPVETGFIVNPLLNKVTLPAGTKFDSYLFHFDPADSAIPSFYDSTIGFSTKIIGVQLFSSSFTALQKPAGTPYTGTLEAGDLAVALNSGPPLTYYPGGSVTRGLEEAGILIDLAGTRIEFGGQAVGTEIDQARVFVAAVPEPTSALLATMGLLGLLFLRITRVGKVCR